MTIPTEPIGSIPRPPELIEALAGNDAFDPKLDGLYKSAIRDTIDRFEATGSPVITDGEQKKYHNFWTYPYMGSRIRRPTASRFLLTRVTPAHAKTDVGPVPLPAFTRTNIWTSPCVRAGASQAGHDLALGVEPDVPRRRRSQAIACGVHR